MSVPEFVWYFRLLLSLHRTQFWVICHYFSFGQNLAPILGSPQDFSALETLANARVRGNLAQSFFRAVNARNIRKLGGISVNFNQERHNGHGSLTIRVGTDHASCRRTPISASKTRKTFLLELASFSNRLFSKGLFGLGAITKVLRAGTGRDNLRLASQKFECDLTRQVLQSCAAFGLGRLGQTRQHIKYGLRIISVGYLQGDRDFGHGCTATQRCRHRGVIAVRIGPLIHGGLSKPTNCIGNHHGHGAKKENIKERRSTCHRYSSAKSKG
eukprot:scaffold1771_cov172-Amphora_coffeaeformis.AAC.26